MRLLPPKSIRSTFYSTELRQIRSFIDVVFCSDGLALAHTHFLASLFCGQNKNEGRIHFQLSLHLRCFHIFSYSKHTFSAFRPRGKQVSFLKWVIDVEKSAYVVFRIADLLGSGAANNVTCLYCITISSREEALCFNSYNYIIRKSLSLRKNTHSIFSGQLTDIFKCFFFF